MDFSFSDIVHRLTQKERHMVETRKLKYGNPSKETKKGGYQKREEKEVHAIEEPQDREQQKNQAKQKMRQSIRLPIAPAIMYKDCLKKGLIAPNPQKELGPNNDKPHWYNDDAYCAYHKVKGHKTNVCML